MVGPGILGILLLVGNGWATDTRTSSRLAVIRTAPDFALITQNGQTLRRSDLNGKVLLVSFIFTTCNGT